MKRTNLFKTISLALLVASIGFVSPKEATAATQGWNLLNGNWYYFADNGKVTTGWFKDGGYWYYSQPNGLMATGWQNINGNWHYFWSSGQMAANTTVDGYYLNSEGAWSVQYKGELTGQDTDGKHHLRTDIGFSNNDQSVADALTYTNINDSNNYLKSLALNLSQGVILIDEAKNNCIGKIIDGYKITDIKFFDQSFKKFNTGTNTDQKIKAIQNSSLTSYTSTSSYKYDAYLSFTCGGSRASEWEAMRVVVELDEL